MEGSISWCIGRSSSQAMERWWSAPWVALIIPNILNISKYFKWWSAPGVALVELSISFIFLEIFQKKMFSHIEVALGELWIISKYLQIF